jgi:plasmid stabilization system protein ParE
MTHAVVFRPQAEEEARAARTWYEHRKMGLGVRFADAISEAIRRIASNPLAFPLVHGETRRAIVRSFPFAAFWVHGDDVVILAAMHGRRHPREWQIRR